MRFLQAPPVVLSLLLLAASTSTSYASVLEDTCKLLVANHADIDYSYCIKFFQADKRSATADMRGLAVIAVNSISATATDTMKRIAALQLSEKNDEKMQGCLAICSSLYKYVVDFLDVDLKEITAVGDGGSSQQQPSPSPSSSPFPDIARYEADACEDRLRKQSEASPLVDKYAEFSKEVSIALSMLEAISPEK